jgi:hypothetical protein
MRSAFLYSIACVAYCSSLKMESRRCLETSVSFCRTTVCHIHRRENSKSEVCFVFIVLCASVLVKSGLENRYNGRRGSAALTMRHPLYPQRLALALPTSGGCSVGIVCSRTKATELVGWTPFWIYIKMTGPRYNGQNLAVYILEYLGMLRHKEGFVVRKLFKITKNPNMKLFM